MLWKRHFDQIWQVLVMWYKGIIQVPIIRLSAFMCQIFLCHSHKKCHMLNFFRFLVSFLLYAILYFLSFQSVYFFLCHIGWIRTSIIVYSTTNKTNPSFWGICVKSLCKKKGKKRQKSFGSRLMFLLLKNFVPYTYTILLIWPFKGFVKYVRGFSLFPCL